MKIPLFTSIPPRMSRLDANGAEIGEAYQRDCIASWRRAGFEPVSVNSANEAPPLALRVISVDRDASAITGRPHVFLADLLAVAARESRGRSFALANADLILTAPDIVDRVAQLQPGEFMFSRRLDIDRIDQTQGTPYPYGYDFFAGHSADLEGLYDSGMVFGAPWWDHWLPIMMLMRGRHIRQYEPTVLHLNHVERWDSSVWTRLGQRFVQAIRPDATDKTYRKRLDDAITPPRRSLRFWKRRPSDAEKTKRMLHRVSDANLLFLDEISQAPLA